MESVLRFFLKQPHEPSPKYFTGFRRKLLFVTTCGEKLHRPFKDCYTKF